MTNRDGGIRRCPYCGAANRAYATFCLGCGESLDEATRLPAPPATAAPPPAGVRSAMRFPRLRHGWWELVLGLCLVVIVVGFAGLDWWQGEQQAAAYRGGLAAAAARDWDTAAGLFAQVPGYLDADQRRAAIAETIRQRNTLYAAGSAAVRQADWITAYRTLSATLALQPGYRDSASLFAYTGGKLTGSALAGTVYRQVIGPTPGLFLRRDGGDLRLPGSDAGSRVWLISPDLGRIIYDGPLSRAASPSAAGAPASGALPPDRQLLLLTVGKTAGQAPATPVVLPHRFGESGRMVATAGGVWWYELMAVDPDLPAFVRIGIVTAHALQHLVFFDPASGRTTETPRGGGTDYLLDVDLARGRLLLAHFTDPAGPAPQTDLLYAGAAPGPPVAVQHLAGLVPSAWLSRDQNLLVYTLLNPGPAAAVQRIALRLHDLSRPVSAAPADRELRRMDATGVDGTAGLIGVLVPGPTADRLLILSWSGIHHALTLLDLASGDEKALPGDGWPQQLAAAPGQNLMPGDAETVLYWYNVAPPRASWPLLAVGVQPPDLQQAAMTLRPLPAPSPVAALAAGTQGREVLIATLQHRVLSNQTWTLGGPIRLYGASLDDPSADPALLLTVPLAADGSPTVLALPRLLAYVSPQQDLRLRTVEDDIDLLGVPGVDAIWSFDRPFSLN